MDPDLNLDKLKAVLRSLLISHRNHNMLLGELLCEFVENEGINVPYHKFGFRSILEFLNSMPDVLKVYGNGPNAFVHGFATPSTKHIEYLVERSVPSKNKRKQGNIFGGGKNSPLANNRNTPKKVPIQSNHNINGETLSSVVSDGNNLQQSIQNLNRNTPKKGPIQSNYNINQKTILSGNPESSPRGNKDNDKPSIVVNARCEHVNDWHGAQTPFKKEMDWIYLLELPTDAMNMKHTIAEPDLLVFEMVKKTIPVRVLNVLNPNRLWVRPAVNATIFEKLKDEMNVYYRSRNDELWRLNADAVQQGLYCAVLYNNFWYRAKIVAPLMGTHVKLHLVDLGVIDILDLENIKYLAKAFLMPHVQAFRASLAYLVPRFHCWSRKTSDHLQKLIEFKQFAAHIVHIDQENNAFELVLRREDNGNVNQIFAADTCAAWVGEDYLRQDVDGYQQRRRTFNEKYPTFFCIEEGHFPSLAELRRSLQRNFDFEYFYSQIPHNPAVNIAQQFKLTMNRIAQNLNPEFGKAQLF